MFRKVFNFLGVQVGWVACVQGAAKGYYWVGPVFVAVFLAIHLLSTSNRSREFSFLLATGALGTCVDSLSKITGLLGYTSDFHSLSWLAPLWIIVLWVLFATSFSASLVWMHGKYLVAVILGAVCGPMSFLAGARLGAITFRHSAWFTLIMLAVIWGLVMPTLLWLSKRMTRDRAETAVLD